MDYFAGLDVSVKATSVCIVDDTGKVVREVKVTSEPEALLAVLKNPAYHFKRIGLEAVGGDSRSWRKTSHRTARSTLRSCRTCQRRERCGFKASQSAIGGCWWALRLRAHRPAAAVVTHGVLPRWFFVQLNRQMVFININGFDTHASTDATT